MDSIIEKPSAITKWIHTITGKSNIKIGRPLEIYNAVAITIAKEGKKFIAFAKTTETGIR